MGLFQHKLKLSENFVLFISRHRMRYMRGVSWAGAIQALLIALTFARVWKDTFDYYNIPSEILYIIVPGGYFFVCWFIGYIDEVNGFWRMEGDYYNKKMNPMWDEWCEIVKNTRECNEKIEVINEMLKKLEGEMYSGGEVTENHDKQ
jgi:hypothetical protein